MAYKTSSYKNIVRCQNCDNPMSSRESFGFPVMTCYPCEYTVDRRGRAARHIIEVPAPVACEVCGKSGKSCRFEKACSCWRGVPCSVVVK